MLRLIYKGKLTAGYYNDMEAGYPVFIGGASLSQIVKELLDANGMDNNFCYEPFEDESCVKNPLVGKNCTLTLEIEDS